MSDYVHGYIDTGAGIFPALLSLDGKWPDLPDLDRRQTYGFVRSGMSGCGYFRYAHESMSGLEEVRPVVVLPRDEEGEVIAPETGSAGDNPRLVQAWLSDPAPLIEGAVDAGIDVDLDRLHVPERAIWRLRNYTSELDGSLDHIDLWLSVKGERGSYWAEIRHHDEPVGSVPKRFVRACCRVEPGPAKQGDWRVAYALYDPSDRNPAPVAMWRSSHLAPTTAESAYIRLRHRYHGWCWLGLERYGEHEHAPCFLPDHAQLITYVAHCHLGDLYLGSRPQYTEDRPELEWAHPLSLGQAEVLGGQYDLAEGKIVPDANGPAMVRHPEHGVKIVAEPTEVWRAPYLQRGHD